MYIIQVVTFQRTSPQMHLQLDSFIDLSPFRFIREILHVLHSCFKKFYVLAK
jgi:hypothetical protein